MRRIVVLLLTGLAAGPLAAQTATDHIAEGRAAAEAFDPRTALRHFEAALAQDSLDGEANWRAALALIDLGKQTPDSVKSPERDSLYARAERYARRAVAADSAVAEAHFALANAAGRVSLTLPPQERLQRAKLVRAAALRAIALDPKHDGAYHVLGRWNAEIMRLPGISRFFAKNFLGEGIFDEASWENATTNLEKAVALRPTLVYHHLDLAEIYIDRERYSDARRHLQRVAGLPRSDVMDSTYKAEAAALLEQIANKKDKN